MKIGLVQANFTVGDLNSNLKKILSFYEQAQQQQCDLLVFPELALTSYPPEDLLLRPDFLQATEQALEQLTQEISALPIIVGVPLQQDNQLQNCAVVLRNQCRIACYAKQCLPNYGVFDEKRYFTPGTKSCVVQFTPDTPKFALLICEDVWHPEPVQQAKQAGAEALLTIHASPFSVEKERKRQQIYASACQMVDLPLLASCLVGAQDDLCFDGGSRALDHTGRIIDQAPFFEEKLLLVDIEYQAGIVSIKPPAAPPAPIMSDIARVYQALVMGIRDYVHKNHFSGALLGLSGGIDSGLTLMLAIDALGVEQVTAVSLPSRFTSQLSIDALSQQVALTGVQLITLSIEPLFTASLETLAQIEQVLGTLKNTTKENLQARCRGILLMALSNQTGKIVLSTGNKSEMAMGYSTLYGDMVGGFAALKDVPKTLIFALARYRNTIRAQIPEIMITRPPSAELAVDQTDQDTLPPYEILDEILYRSIDLQQSIKQIVAAGFNEETVKWVVKYLYRNEYKRRQAAPGIKITSNSFTRERRYPITSNFDT